MYAETIFKYEESLLSHRISSIERIISKQKESITHPSLLHECSSYKISISLRELVNQIVNHRGRENAPQHGEGAGAGGGPGMPPPPPRGAQGSMAVCTTYVTAYLTVIYLASLICRCGVGKLHSGTLHICIPLATLAI